MSRPLKLGVIGCGTLTSGVVMPHLVQADFREHGEVVAVCDLVEARARGVAERFGVPAAYAEVELLLARSDAEAVLVITPGTTHADVAIAALRAGRHVYVQKPMAPTSELARLMLSEAQSRDLVLSAAPGQALWPLFSEMRDLIRAGELGPVYMASPPMLGWPGRNVNFPTNPSHFFSATGGPLHDHGGYGVQTLVTLLGPVRRVSAMQANVTPRRMWNGKTEIDTPGMDNTVALLDFGNGAFAMMHDGWCARSPGSSILRVHGLEGSMETSLESCNDLALLPHRCAVTARGEIRQLEVDLAGVTWCRNGHIGLGHVHVFGDILHWVMCIRRGLKPVNGPERGLHFVEVIEACVAAARTGQTQTVPTPLAPDPEVLW